MKEYIDLCKTDDDGFMELWRKICLDAQKANDDWIETLKKNGVDAAHPDDGWVNRERNEMLLCYPQFDKGVKVGSLVAPGCSEKYRTVKIIGYRAMFFGDDVWWKFEATENPT